VVASGIVDETDAVVASGLVNETEAVVASGIVEETKGRGMQAWQGSSARRKAGG
jgi:hypothetical protein